MYYQASYDYTRDHTTSLTKTQTTIFFSNYELISCTEIWLQIYTQKCSFIKMKPLISIFGLKKDTVWGDRCLMKVLILQVSQIGTNKSGVYKVTSMWRSRRQHGGSRRWIPVTGGSNQQKAALFLRQLTPLPWQRRITNLGKKMARTAGSARRPLMLLMHVNHLPTDEIDWPKFQTTCCKWHLNLLIPSYIE